MSLSLFAVYSVYRSSLCSVSTPPLQALVPIPTTPIPRGQMSCHSQVSGCRSVAASPAASQASVRARGPPGHLQPAFVHLCSPSATHMLRRPAATTVTGTHQFAANQAVRGYLYVVTRLHMSGGTYQFKLFLPIIVSFLEGCIFSCVALLPLACFLVVVWRV